MYKNSKIYKMVNDDMNLTYYGSTIQPLTKRMNSHKKESKQKRKCKSSDLFLTGECKIYLVEEYPCDTREQLLQRERYWIENNDCVNKCMPIITDEERKAYRSAWAKKPENLQKGRDWKKKNAERLSLIRKEKVSCDVCGKELTKYNLVRHKKKYCSNI